MEFYGGEVKKESEEEDRNDGGRKVNRGEIKNELR